MKLIDVEFDLSMELEENTLNTIVLESPIALRNIINNILLQCSGKEGPFVLTNEEKIVKLDKKCDILLNPYLINSNNKKIITKLYSEMKNAAQEIWEEWSIANSKLLQFIESVVDQIPYDNIFYNSDIEMESIWKAYNIRFSTSENILESLIDYIKIIGCLLHIDVLFLVNFREYFSEKEFFEIYKMACYNKVNLVLIESYERRKNSEIKEKTYIVDKDLCTIVK